MEKLDLPLSGNAEAICDKTNSRYLLTDKKLQKLG